MEPLFKYNLGDEVRDAISGFQGIVTARIDYITGCARYIVQPQTLGKDGEPHKSSTFDENTLELVQAGKVKIGNATGDAIDRRFNFERTSAEIQAGSTRLDHAEGLIEQLPESHEGAATWLLNYGVRDRAQALRHARQMTFNIRTRAAEGSHGTGNGANVQQTTAGERKGGPIEGPQEKAGPE